MKKSNRVVERVHTFFCEHASVAGKYVAATVKARAHIFDVLCVGRGIFAGEIHFANQRSRGNTVAVFGSGAGETGGQDRQEKGSDKAVHYNY